MRLKATKPEHVVQALLSERERLRKRRDSVGRNSCEGSNATLVLRALGRVLAVATRLEPKIDTTICGYCGRKLTKRTGEGPDRALDGGWRCIDACGCCRRQGTWCGCPDHPDPAIKRLERLKRKKDA